MKFNFRSIFLLSFLFFSFSILAQPKDINSTQLADTTFVNLKDYSADFVYDMKYATNDNFLKTKVYDCAECFLRLQTVRALILANAAFLQRGYKIKLYDCYRPLSIQKKMWEIVPNPIYVADPKKGSIHNRGGAVDISLVSLDGTELEMGTAFDHFGIEASHQYSKLSKQVKNNRKLLKSVMQKNGFNSFDSEWWHYNLKAGLNEKVSNTKWKCD
ncbi:M15 family metallopeptidase [Flavobacterium agrisoli]|uniref:D-alanyl-D-alanine dipeptidase n=1 Tax=Flavobacterium agrisoli TaxID=2793066 RepID=A0A934PJD2_9FLAO|nr:M15 family metallopeptidase [Flavobacterium agrisoli]MBK0368440.1 M15 family metallopeptidase [Flavobacterium agrisoli]